MATAEGILIIPDHLDLDANNFACTPKLFGKWTYEDLKVSDTTLTSYVSVQTTKTRVFVPHTAGRYQLKAFRKASCPLIERLMGTVAYHGRNTGKKIKAMKIVKQALDIVHHHTGVNPLQVTHLFPTIQYHFSIHPMARNSNIP
jgi:small subunit ribosomal protein S5e